MRFHPAACKMAFYALALLLAGHSGSVIAGAKADAVQQLIQSTSLVNILRTDAEQASLIVDRLPEDLPAELRSDLRRAIDQNLGYDEMEAALVKAVAATLDPSTLESSLRWWSSPPGRAISTMESIVYAGIFADSTFGTFNPTTGTRREMSPAESIELMASGHFEKFVTDLLSSTAAARSCLLSTISMGADCLAGEAVGKRVDDSQLLQAITAAMSADSARVSSGDLGAYVAYLRSESAQSMLGALRAALLAVEQHGWENARKQAAKAIDDYARRRISPGREATLRQVIADVDHTRNLARARITLELLRRAGPPDPAVLVQLARVTLEQAPGITDSDVPPFVPRLDQASLQTAQRWLDEALMLDTHRTETLMMLGYVAYLKWDFKHSLALLEQARAIGPDSAWLLVDHGNTLWAIGSEPGARNDTLIKQAVDNFQAALGMHPPDGARFMALHQLSAAYAALGDIEKAGSFHRQLISMTQGTNKAYSLHRYAIFLLFDAHDVDAAVVAMREAVTLDNFELGRAFLVNVLTVKAGMLYTAGRAREAAPYIAEARQIQPDLESTCPNLARLPGSFPGVFAIHAAGLLKHFSGSIGGRTLVLASRYATADEIKQLLSWGANPNYFDSEEGAPLHAAVQGENTAAITVLLAAGANPLTPYVDGRTPSQMTDSASAAKIAQIRTLVVNAARARTAKAGSVGTPLRAGYRYRMKKPISGDRWGNDFATGEEFIFIDNNCQFTDSTLACFNVKRVTKPDQIRDMALAKDQLSSWKNWFEELGPEKSSSPQ